MSQGFVRGILSSLEIQSQLRTLLPALLQQIASIASSGELTGDLAGSTGNFLDRDSPTLINTILATTPKDKEHGKMLNSILAAYIPLIPQFLFSPSRKFLKAAEQIVTKSAAVFYTETNPVAFTVFLSTSQDFFVANQESFLRLNILAIYDAHFAKNQPFSGSISFETFQFI
jgi:hypothetical protein